MPGILAKLLIRFWPAILIALLAGGPSPRVLAQSHEIAQADPALSETGTPLFAVQSKETLGLNVPPTDLHLLPDGRILLVAERQLAFGDGTRWTVFNQAPDQPPSRALTVAVDGNGEIYGAIRDGFGRIVVGSDGHWRFVKVADWPASEPKDRPVPRRVIVTDDQWFWHSGSGSIISWRPGHTPMSVGEANAMEQIIPFGGEYLLSDRVISDGAIIRISGRERTALGPRERILPHGLITCGLPLGEKLLIGTSAHGVRLFDGKRAEPLVREGILAGGNRINDLAAVGGGFYAAAVENHGVVFFDATGRISQTLDRAVDHRLARASRLFAGSDGTVWGLLGDGILQIGFPSRFSYFEPLVSTGLATAHPRRLSGRLWLSADNQIQRATYDANNRLNGFEHDTPQGQVIFTMSNLGDIPVGGTLHGAYYRDPSGWRPFAPETSNLRTPHSTPVEGQWLYTARDQVGWIRMIEDVPSVTSYPAPGLGDVYNSIDDGRGFIWLERGTSKLARIHPARPDGTAPRVDLFGPADGLPQGWAQVFVIDGVVRFNVADQILRHDEATGRIVPDREFREALGEYGMVIGRPGRDALGRLWVTTERGIFLFEGDLKNLRPVAEPMPGGFQPYYFTFESGGVVWMHSSRRLVRYDPHFPSPPPQPLRALITHVTLPGTGETFYPRYGSLPQLAHSENTLIPHFLATGSGPLASVTFEVKLEGAGQGWVSVGNAGSTIFNRLEEGNYTLLVRPTARGVVGETSTLRFSIAPPWYRTAPAYFAGAVLLMLLILLIGQLFVYLDRREKHRLEELVTQRTSELAAQVEENRTLSEALQQSPVGVLLIKPDGAIVFANSRVCSGSGYTIAELVGRSLDVLRLPSQRQTELDATFAAARGRGESWQAQVVNRAKDGRLVHVRVTASPLRNQTGEIALYLILEEDITETLAEQERHRKLETQLFQAQKRESLGTLAGGIAHDFNNILTGILGYCELAQLALGPRSLVEQELAAISAAGRRAKDLVSQILSFTRPRQAQLVPLDLARPISEALKLIRASTPTSIEIVQHVESGIVRADASQIHQITLNLCTNAIHAMRERAGRLEVRLEPAQLSALQSAEYGAVPSGNYLKLSVSDTGCGMAPGVLDRIFDPFFTTKDPGEGTGLGLSIVQNIVTSHRGGLRVRSEPGVGTTFELVFPLSTEERVMSQPPMSPPVGDDQEILVVDDEQMVTDFVAARLRQLAYRPLVHHDPRSALLELASAPKRFAALITDLTMPHMSGVELVREARAQGVSIPVLIITGYNRDSNRADLASLPDVQLLQKPFTGEELAHALNRVLEAAATP